MAKTPPTPANPTDAASDILSAGAASGAPSTPAVDPREAELLNRVSILAEQRDQEAAAASRLRSELESVTAQRDIMAEDLVRARATRRDAGFRMARAQELRALVAVAHYKHTDPVDVAIKRLSTDILSDLDADAQDAAREPARS